MNLFKFTTLYNAVFIKRLTEALQAQWLCWQMGKLAYNHIVYLYRNRNHVFIMEIHHHSHSSRKKWTHYIWEFLMLFLAVFCGFLAENLREHLIEKKKEKEYISSFYEDLKTDTTRINAMILFDLDKLAGLQSMEPCYDSISRNLASSDCLVNLILYSRTNRAFTITDRTINQLINAAGFRIINRQDADSVLSFINESKTYMDFQSTIFQSCQENVRNTLSELASYKAVNGLLQTPGSNTGTTSSTINSDMKAEGNLLFSGDMNLLYKWFNQLLIYKRVTNSQMNQLLELHMKATGLINYFKRKYSYE